MDSRVAGGASSSDAGRPGGVDTGEVNGGPVTMTATEQPDTVRHRATLSQALRVRPRRTRLQGDTRGYVLRRWLLVADVAALCVAFGSVEIVAAMNGRQQGSLAVELALLAVGIPVWLTLLRAYGLYHVD